MHFQRNVAAHAGKSGRRVVSAFIATAFAQPPAEAASTQWRAVADQIRPEVTGHGADYIIIDDLLKAGDANSETELNNAQDFVLGTLLSRFNDPSQARVVMIGQRLQLAFRVGSGWLPRS